MNKKKLFIALVGSGALGANQALETHLEHAKIEKPFATKPIAKARYFGVLPHGNHPAHPNGPLQTTQTIVASTAVGMGTVASLDYLADWTKGPTKSS